MWQAPDDPRRAIVLLAGKLLGVVRIASHGSNMGFDGENGVCSFSENWRRRRTLVLRLSSPSRLGQGIVTWAQRQTQIHQASRKRRLLFCKQRQSSDPMLMPRERNGGGGSEFFCVRTRTILRNNTKIVLLDALATAYEQDRPTWAAFLMVFLVLVV
jgi:hypothetical protein